jgi:hypothetical protein
MHTGCTWICRNHRDQSIEILYLSSSIVLLFCSKWYFLNQSQDSTVLIWNPVLGITIPQYNDNMFMYLLIYSVVSDLIVLPNANIVCWRANSLIKRKYKLLYQFLSERIRFNVSTCCYVDFAGNNQ